MRDGYAVGSLPTQIPNLGSRFQLYHFTLHHPEQVTYLLWASVSPSVKWACAIPLLLLHPPGLPKSLQASNKTAGGQRPLNYKTAGGVTVAIFTALNKKS